MDIFAAIGTALKKRGKRGKRGTLRAWMAENYAAFEDRLQTRKPDGRNLP